MLFVKRLILPILFVSCGLGGIAWGTPVPTVTISTELSGGGTTLSVGDTRTITVSALVTDPSNIHDGLFSFDQDLIFTNVSNPGDPSQISVFGAVNRPNSSGGGDGITTSAGVSQITGTYIDENRGIGTSQVLYQLMIQATAPGMVNIVSGPDTVPYGFDIVLYDSSNSINVNYLNGPVLTVNAASMAVPAPSGAMGIGAGLMGLWIGRRVRRSQIENSARPVA